MALLSITRRNPDTPVTSSKPYHGGDTTLEDVHMHEATTTSCRPWIFNIMITVTWVSLYTQSHISTGTTWNKLFGFGKVVHIPITFTSSTIFRGMSKRYHLVWGFRRVVSTAGNTKDSKKSRLNHADLTGSFRSKQTCEVQDCFPHTSGKNSRLHRNSWLILSSGGQHFQSPL